MELVCAKWAPPVWLRTGKRTRKSYTTILINVKHKGFIEMENNLKEHIEDYRSRLDKLRGYL